MDLTHTTELIEALSNTDTSQIFIDKSTEDYVIYRSNDETALKTFGKYLSRNNVFNKITTDGRLYTTKKQELSELYDKFDKHQLDSKNEFIIFGKALNDYNKADVLKLEKDFKNSKQILNKISKAYNYIALATFIVLVSIVSAILLVPFSNIDGHIFKKMIAASLISTIIIVSIQMILTLLFYKKESFQKFSILFLSNLYIHYQMKKYQDNKMINEIVQETMTINIFGFADDVKQTFNHKYLDVHFLIDYLNQNYNNKEVIYNFTEFIFPDQSDYVQDIARFYKSNLYLI